MTGTEASLVLDIVIPTQYSELVRDPERTNPYQDGVLCDRELETASALGNRMLVAQSTIF